MRAEALPISGADVWQWVGGPKGHIRFKIEEALREPALAFARWLVPNCEACVDHHLNGGSLNPL